MKPRKLSPLQSQPRSLAPQSQLNVTGQNGSEPGPVPAFKPNLPKQLGQTLSFEEFRQKMQGSSLPEQMQRDMLGKLSRDSSGSSWQQRHKKLPSIVNSVH